MKTYYHLFVVGLAGLTLFCAGCSKEVDESGDGHSHNDGHDHSHDGHDHDHDHHDHDGHDHDHDHPATTPSAELTSVVLSSGAPSNFVGVAHARTTANNGDEVVVEGRLKDFNTGKAAFTMVDGSIKSCLEEGDGCKTPWDYCCASPAKLRDNTATVKLVDAQGKLLDGNLKGVNKLDNLTTVVVQGRAEKDEAGNLAIAAANVYIK